MISIVLDTLLPGDAGLHMPSAASIDFASYQQRHACAEEIAAFLALLAELAQEHHAQPFATLDAAQRLALVNRCKVRNIRLFSSFVTHCFRAYYADARVLQAIGAGAVPPFPQGNPMPTDDWDALEPVFERGKIYRDAPGL